MAYVDGSRTKGGQAYRQKTSLKRIVMERDNYTCYLCGRPAQEVDHVIPWAISHNSTLSNLRAICIKCNRATRRQRKDANPFKTIDDWYDYIRRELANSASLA